MTDFSPRLVAELLLAAEADVTARGPLTAEWPEFDAARAYEAQDIALELRLARGERLIGVKLGVTSRAKQLQVNVSEPSVAWLTDAMHLGPDVPLPRDVLIQPRAEPEIVFVMGRDLTGPGVTAAEAMAAVAFATGGVEIIDSRFSGYQFTVADAIADNSSSAYYVTSGVMVRPETLDLTLEGVLLEVDGAIVDSATGAAILGHPGQALAFAANKLAERGLGLREGWVVLTGGMTEAVPVGTSTRIAAHFSNLGSISIQGSS